MEFGYFENGDQELSTISSRTMEEEFKFYKGSFSYLHQYFSQKHMK